MVDIVTRLGKGSPLTNAEVDANFTNLAEVSGVTGEPMGHEDRTTSTISFNASTRTFTIAPVASSFTVWCKGKKVVVSSAQTVTIPNTTGMYSIYYDANGVLSAKSGYFTFSLEAPTAYIYWNATAGTCPYFGDERHGVVLDWQTHEYLHRTRGAALASGFAASGYVLGGNGSSNSHAQITLEGGTFFDEDMKIVVTATNTPTAGTWEQDLLSPARIPVLYLSGTGWVIDAPSDYPLKQGASRPQYNAYSGGVWSTADVANNKYATSWILATNNLTYPVIAIIGQAESDLQSAAEAVDFTELQLPGFPSVEFRPLYKLIFQCADSCTNAVHASLVSITDIRSIAAAGTAASIVSDHGNLTGLSDDDHPQYIHVDTLRTVSDAVKASFLPSQTSNAGKFLQTDGTATSWQALTSSNVTTALGFTPYNDTNPSGYISGISSSDVTTALGYTPYNATNPSGYVSIAGARGAISVTGAGSYDVGTGVIDIVGGVTSFNTRTGAITLSSTDVTDALGYVPYRDSNPSNYLTSINSTMVTTALGYTPYNSSNPNGYISTISSSMVTSALGFTPYDNSNPSGYVTSSSLSGYLTSASAVSTYLPLGGGTMTGPLVIDRSSGGAEPYIGLTIKHTGTSAGIKFQSNARTYEIQSGSDGVFLVYDRTAEAYRFTIGTDGTLYQGNSANAILHAGNKDNYTYPPASHTHSYLPLSGGTMTGQITMVSGTPWQVLAPGSGTYNKHVQYISGTEYTLEAAFATDSLSGSKLPITFTWRGGYGSTGGLQLTGGASGTLGGNIILHAGNYTSYSASLANTVRTENGVSRDWNGQNLNELVSTGFWRGSGMTGAPDTGWWYITVEAHDTPAGTGWVKQRVTAYGAGNSYSAGTTFTRVRPGGASWNGWIREIDADNYSSYALPVSGGTLSGYLQVGNAATYDNPGGWNANIVASGQYHARVRVKATSYNSSGDNEAYLWVDNTVSPRSGLYSSTAFNMNVAGGLYESGSRVLNSSNYSSYALPLSGGTVTGTLGTSHSSQATAYLGGISSSWGGTAYPTLYSSAADRWVMVMNTHVSYTQNGVNGFTGSMTGATIRFAANPSAGSYWDVGVGTNGVGADTFSIGRAGSSFYKIANDGSTTIGTNYGNLVLGPLNSSYSHFQTDRPQFYFNKTVYVDGNIYQYGSSYLYLHSGNYNSYSPSLTGSGASGTWGISVTGSASSVGGYTSDGWLRKVSDSTQFQVYGNTRAIIFRTDGVTNEHGGGGYPFIWYYGGSGDGERRMILNTSGQLYTSNYGWLHDAFASSSHTHSYLPLSGGLMTGDIRFSGTARVGVEDGGIDCYLEITDQNPTYDGYGFGGEFFMYGDKDVGSSLLEAGGIKSRTQMWVSGNRVLHAGNYTNYAVGASNYYNSSSAGPLGKRRYRIHSADGTSLNSSIGYPECGFTYGGSGEPAGPYIAFGGLGGNIDYSCQLVGQYNASGNYFVIRTRNDDAGSWNAWRTIITDGNYGSYAVPLSGGTMSGRLTISPGWTTDGRNYSNEWIEFGNYSGLYSPQNSAHFYPNNASYGAWRIAGSRNGWGGLQFDATNGAVCLMIGTDSNTTGFHNPSYGWQLRWAAGSLYCYKNSYGGGTDAIVLDSSNYSSYALPLSGGSLSGSLTINNSSPTIYLQDTDNRSAMIHVNSNTFYVLRGSGTNSGSWSTYNSYWPLELNLENNNATFGGNLTAIYNITAYSDERLKTDWQGLPSDFISRLAEVKTGTYTRIDSGERQAGSSAQDWRQLLPEVVTEADNEEKTLSLAYGNAALVSAVELAKEVVDLRNRVAQLESLINKLIGD